MSKVHPFPTNPSRRAQSPAVLDGSQSNPNSPPATLPLSINKQPRPSTPNGSSPARPIRSDLRARNVSQQSQSSISSRLVNRESYATAPSEPGTPKTRRPEPGGSDEPPRALAAALNAFQVAGASRRRGMSNGTSENDRQRQTREKGRQRTMDSFKSTGDIDAILDKIKGDWEDVLVPEFNPVDLSLQLLDNSSVGRDIDSFRRTKALLSRALQRSINKNHQAFAAALPHHASFLNHLSSSQSQITAARSALQDAKEALGSKRSDLVQLWSRGQTLEEMLILLDQIEHLKSVPDVLESLISEKRFLQASVLLVQSLKMACKQDMQEIGAVSDLRAYLRSQETSLRDILIDELHSHLYLKSFWCESRWSSYTPNQRTLPSVPYDTETAGPEGKGSSSGVDVPRLHRYLGDLSVRSNDAPYDLSQLELTPGANRSRTFSAPPVIRVSDERTAGRNPEADSFVYMEMLLESLAVLGKLCGALDIVTQRLPNEVYSLIEGTLEEVGERGEISKRISEHAPAVNGPSSVYVFLSEDEVSPSDNTILQPRSLRLAALESSEKEGEYEILRDLFWTLFSKLDALIQGLRVVHEVSNRIGSRRDFKDGAGSKPSTFFPLVDVWLPIQSEIGNLLNDYLSDEQKGSAPSRNPISSINEVLRDGKFTTRDKYKQVFKFVESPQKHINQSLQRHEDELFRILRSTFPGLVQGSVESATQALNVVGDDRLIGVEHHRQLVRPDAFHVSVVFQPTMTFLQRLSQTFPSGVDTARMSVAMLDEFVHHVFIPQLEERTSYLLHQALTDSDAFQEDAASWKLSSEPLIKSSIHLIALVNSLCSMSRTTPTHLENYSRLVLSVIIQFYQRCSDRFYSLVAEDCESPTEGRTPASIKLTQSVELCDCLSKLLQAILNNEPGVNAICDKETSMELELLGKEAMSKGDCIGSIKNISTLANLYHSIIWLVKHLNNLKSRSEHPVSPNGLTFPTTPSAPTLPDNVLQLRLSHEMSLRFDALTKTFEQLASLILCTIRLDIRCRIVYYLDLAIRHGNYRIDREANEPDSHIVDLSNDLITCDEQVAKTLPAKERRFVFEGLESLIEHQLITNARRIRFANSNGNGKILRNILALRQCTRMMSGYTGSSEFSRSRNYFSLFYVGPGNLILEAKSNSEYSFDEFKAILDLQCGVDQTQGESGATKSTDRNYSTYLTDLFGIMFSEGDIQVRTPS